MKSKVRVDRSKANGAYEIVACSQRYMDMGSRVAKVLSQSEIDKIDPIVNSNHEIIGLDVTMYIVMSMKEFQSI